MQPPSATHDSPLEQVTPTHAESTQLVPTQVWPMPHGGWQAEPELPLEPLEPLEPFVAPEPLELLVVPEPVDALVPPEPFDALELVEPLDVLLPLLLVLPLVAVVVPLVLEPLDATTRQIPLGSQVSPASQSASV